MFFDTHVHLDSWNADADLPGMVARAREAGVTRMLAMGGSPEQNAGALAGAAAFPSCVAAALGYDRDCAERNPDSAALEATIREHPEVVALGEIGLDFHYHPDTQAQQETLFARMLALARTLRLPAVVHSREAEARSVSLLREHVDARPAPHDPERIGVLHCFTGSRSFAGELLDLGLYVSFSGVVTFRNAGPLREVARYIPGNRLLIETDAPYLAPVPHRGERNEPARVCHVADVLAEVRGCRIEDLAAMTTANAERLFSGPARVPVKGA